VWRSVEWLAVETDIFDDVLGGVLGFGVEDSGWVFQSWRCLVWVCWRLGWRFV
jgi:hypothetical protein